MKQDIERVLTVLENNTSQSDGYFSILNYGDGPDASFIRANRDGLRLFATELLKASIDKEHEIGNPELKWLYEKSDTWIHHIEIIEAKQKDYVESPQRQTWLDKMIPKGLAILFIVGVFLSMIGLKTVIGWIK